MVTKPKSNSVVTSFVTADGIIHITVLGAGRVEFDPYKAHPNMRARAEYHGWIQRLSDGAAKSRDPLTGRSAQPGEKLVAVQAIANHYQSGVDEWKMKGAGRTPLSEIILQALCSLNDVKVETMRERIARMAEVKKTTPERLLAAMAARKDISEEVLRIQAERAGAPELDTDELVDELIYGE